ncbi:MAG: rod shape-determining protein MreC [Alphaproteobacteria bacterium]
MRYRDHWLAKYIVPIKAVTRRLTLAFLIIAAFGLMLMGKAETVLVESSRTAVADIMTPVLDALSRPTSAIMAVTDGIIELVNLREQNANLRRENEYLRQKKQQSEAIEAENANLRNLLNFIPEAAVAQITARVIADEGGAFLRTVMVNTGLRSGLHKGMVAVGGTGLVGRVAEVGERSARILLLTDLNSRIPVLIESSRHRAVMAGDNSDWPRLIYLAPNAVISAGDRIVTSGHGGVFPSGIPVGIVVAMGDGSLRVKPYVDFTRLEYVRILDYGLEGMVSIPETGKARFVGR